jgi:ABC-type transport system involved in multi-copper enzyme maturation permease subunit
MSATQTVASIARVEAKLLFRSWGFRIFSGLALVILTLIMITIAMPTYASFYFSRALSGAFPLIAIKILNVFQGIMAVFLATEFLKRDRKQDTTEVVFAHSFSNGQYVIGKFLGIFGVFLLLNFAVLLITFVIHVFFSHTLFAAESYLLYIGLLSLPTLVFMIGLPIFIGSLIRSQAIIYLLTLSYIFISLIVIGPRFSYAFDSFAFYTPIMYSDFIGLGNLPQLLPLRGAYFFLGVGLILGSALLMKRLGQSRVLNKILGVLALLFVAAAAGLGYTYLHGVASSRDFREGIKAESREVAGKPAMTLLACNLRLRHEGKTITATADLILANHNDAALKTIYLSLNPGLRISEVKGESGTLDYRKNHHLVAIEAKEAIAPGGEIRLSLSYSGTIDERYCYLDIDDAKRDTPLKIWLVSVPKRYAVVSPNFVHLTPECGWYPRPGLAEALLFPSLAKKDFCRFTLTVEAAESLTAVSQGIPTIDGAGRKKTYIFRPETLLPQISLTLGRYEKKSVTVDQVQYSLFLLGGHDRFTPKLKEIGGELPQLIKQIKDGYEVVLGLNYPYKQLSLVEVPIHITGYNRLWTMAQEQVQPQLVFLPEMGVLCAGAEFRVGPMAGPGGRGGAAGQRVIAVRGGGQISPKDIQRALFNRFIISNLITAQPGLFGGQQRAALGGAPLGILVETNSEAAFNIFPNFLAYSSPLDVAEWPLFGYALESYLRERAGSPAVGPMRLGQGNSTLQDEINKFLMDHSLAEAIRLPGGENRPVIPILQQKGRALLILIRAKLGAADFDDRLIAFLKDRRFQSVTRKSMEDFIAGLGRLDLDKTIASWYEQKGLPGFLFDDVQSYRVIDKEKTKFQIKFQVTNPTDQEGVIKINMATMGGFGARGGGVMGGVMGMSASAPETRTVLVQPRTIKEVGIVLDRASAMTTIDTAMSRNLPGMFTLPFSNQQPKPGVKPFDGESARPYIPVSPGVGGEYIVDNEDAGFKLPEKGRENWLRSMVRRIFVPAQSEEDYATFGSLINPPDNWEPLVMQNFYGRFVRSGLVKKSGQGTSKVAWSVNLKEAGDYNIYFYYEGIGAGMGRGGGMTGMGRGGFAPGGGQPPGGQRGGGGTTTAQSTGRGSNALRLQPGKKHFLIHHEGRAEEVVVDLRDVPAGWTLIGNFRLATGENLVELTDKNEERFVLADAIKWVEQK